MKSVTAGQFSFSGSAFSARLCQRFSAKMFGEDLDESRVKAATAGAVCTVSLNLKQASNEQQCKKRWQQAYRHAS